MDRYLSQNILSDLKNKMVFITGPRQVGKTFLAKSLMSNFKKPVYLNYDDIEDFKIIENRIWPVDCDLVILDEIHKKKEWKNYIKGTFDKRFPKQNFIITGSARLDIIKSFGDSLAGRYFLYKLYPLSVKELIRDMPPEESLSLLNKLGGFPEPFFSGSQEYSERWRNQYFDSIIREDVLEMTKINEIRTMRILLEMLRERTCSPISFLSLSRDLQISPHTVKKYLEILESLYAVFFIRPFHKNISRSIIKEPKIYFYDSGYVKGDEGKKLENTFAVSLLKHVEYIKNTTGKNITLNYIRTKENKETDFAICEDDKPKIFLEVKLSDYSVSKNLIYFKNLFKEASFVQAVYNITQEAEYNGIKIIPASQFLARLEA